MSNGKRLEILRQIQVLDSLPESTYNDVALLAAQLFRAPVAALSLIERECVMFHPETRLSPEEGRAIADFALNQQVPVIGFPFALSVPLELEDGTPIGALMVFDREAREATASERRALETLARQASFELKRRLMLENAETRFQSIFANTPFGMQICKPDGTLVQTNEVWRKLYGVSAAENQALLFGKVNVLKDPRFDQFQLISHFEAALQRQPHDDFARVFEIPFGETAGARRWVEVSSTAIVDGFGIVTEVLLMFHDVTARHEAEEKLGADRRLLQEILDYAPACIFVKDLEGRVILTNQIFDRLFNFDRAKDLGRKTNHDIWPKDVADAFHANDQRVVRSGLPIHMEETAPLADGVHTYVSVKFPLRDANGQVRAVCGISTDITEQKRLEREGMKARVSEQSALEAARMKTEFLANMSHELRTPLNGVIGLAELLLDSHLAFEQSEYARSIMRSGEHLLALIDDVLDFSKLEANEMRFEASEFDLGGAVEEVHEILRHGAYKKNLRLAIEIAPDLPKMVSGDVTRFKQVLLNLGSNAVKFTDSGSVVIRARSMSLTPRSLGLRLEVDDTGPGLSAEAKASLFQPFSQGDSSSGRKFGGTGLGLSLSHAIVTKMKGTIGVIEKDTGGSVFWFEVQLNLPAVVAAARSLVPRILVAEDDGANQLIIKRMIEKLGYKFEIVQNGAEALRRLREESFDLVLMDCKMPEMDGYETTRRIRASSTLASAIPIIAYTAHAGPEEAETCLASGMNDYISKPVTIADLRATIDPWLTRRRDSA